MNKKKKISELMQKLEEISKINDALLLENAEHKARLKTAAQEHTAAEIEKSMPEELNDSGEAAQNIPMPADAIDKEEIFKEIAGDLLGDTEFSDKNDSSDESTEDSFQIIRAEEAEDEISASRTAREIEALKLRSDKIEAELTDIRELLLKQFISLNPKTENTEVIKEEKALPKRDEKSDAELAGITKNVGKLIIDAQLGAARIIDRAKADAEAQLQKAQQEADLILSQAEFRSRNIYKSFCDAETEVDQIIMKMESLSEQIQKAKTALKS